MELVLAKNKNHVAHQGSTLHSFSFRKYTRRLHLWLGLSLGVLLTIICLSGAMLVFYVEIDTWLHPELERSQLATDSSWDSALHTLNNTYPDKKGPWRIEVSDSKRAMSARYYNPVETRSEGFAPLMVWLSNDGLSVLREDYWGHYLVTWLYNLHYTLLFGEIGTIVIGYIGLATLLLLVSGLVSWWPKQGQWHRALKFKRRRSRIGLLYDWHKILGLASVIPLLLLVATGVMLSLPQETNKLLGLVFSPVQTTSKLSGVVNTTIQHTVPISAAITAARQAKVAKNGADLLQSHLAWIQTPDNSLSAQQFYTFRFQIPEDPSHRFPNTFVHVDAHSGQIINIFSAWKHGPANSIKGWLHALHNGSVGGLALRVLWVICGLIVFALFTLGFTRWRLRTGKNAPPALKI
ncbi:PepSY-associated TM helix domain-containing protein [Paraglaciecola sp. 20A4]|uniref:PepSY-associated TM helix domain-containing protein n=1 Tax=Paraglaciecola sp. 20A4 TaxID=2687288 RepID=UPI001F10D986|nr:PepSY-associated TM helix domain-containing protein [Paraglaciecola sp. 20A4]